MDSGDYSDGKGQFKWFMVFAKTMVAAAYEAAATGPVIDITQHKDYKDPFAPERRHQSVRDAMRTMYGIIRDRCDFREKEGMYYVRNSAQREKDRIIEELPQLRGKNKSMSLLFINCTASNTVLSFGTAAGSLLMNSSILVLELSINGILKSFQPQCSDCEKA